MDHRQLDEKELLPVEGCHSCQKQSLELDLAFDYAVIFEEEFPELWIKYIRMLNCYIRHHEVVHHLIFQIHHLPQ